MRTESEELRAQLEAARAQTEALERQLAESQRELELLRRADQERLERYVAVERKAARLAALQTATQRLQQAGTRGEVVLAIEEIITALVGSEELAVFELEGTTLRLVKASGVDPAALSEISLGEGEIGAAALQGQTYLAPAGAPEDERAPTACVPLWVGRTPVGAIAIFRLLPQKDGFDAGDLDLFELLSSQAAMALWCTRPPRSVA